MIETVYITHQSHLYHHQHTHIRLQLLLVLFKRFLIHIFLWLTRRPGHL
jgi:hypothetical protein